MNAIARPFRWFATTRLAHSLRFRLVMIVLLASLPSLALLLLTAAQQRDEALAAGQGEATRLARLVAADQSNTSAQIELVLSTMALLPELRGASAASCGATLQPLTATAGEPESSGNTQDFRVDGASFQQLAVLESDLTPFCAGPAGTVQLADEDRTLALNALEHGTLVTGNYRASATGSMIATYAVPFSSESGGRRVLVATMDIYALTRFAREANLPDESIIVVLGHDGVLEQRYPSDSAFEVGQSLAGTPVVDETTSGESGDADDVDDSGDAAQQSATVNGETYLYASDDFWTPGAQGTIKQSFTLVGLPRNAVVERANEKFNENLGKLAIAGIIALIAAWVGADLFVGRDSETRKGQIRDLYHAFSTGTINSLDQLIGPGFVDRNATPDQAPGIDGLRQNIAAFRTAFPDGKITVRELLADQDKVVARVTLSGTHVADYFGIAPSGKQVTAEGVETFRFVHGMVVESWSMFGALKPRERVAEETPPVVPERPRRWRLFGRRGSRAAPSEARR